MGKKVLEACLSYLDKKPEYSKRSVKENMDDNCEIYENDIDHNYSDENYNESVRDTFCESFDYVTRGVDKGEDIGMMVLGITGACVGAFIGGFVGCLRDLWDELF